MSYAALALLFLVVPVVLVVAAAVVVRPDRRWWTATAAVLGVLLVLTAVFDSLMIAVDLFRFDEDRLLGPHIGKAPVEDFAWPLASTLALPALWVLLGRRSGRRGLGRTRSERSGGAS
jgi:lycopene cyclase domain-containing protein